MKYQYLLAILFYWAISNIARAQAPNWEWVRTAGGEGFGVSTDANGNIYVTGTNGYVFLAKYDPSGNVIWARDAGAVGGVQISGISVDPEGNAFITGSFGDTIIFGSDTLISDKLSGYTYFITKYDSSGNAIWTKNMGTNAYVQSISTDTYGNLYVTGGFTSATLILGNDTLTNSFINNPTVFIVKYSASGNVIWAKCGEGYALAYSEGISTDANDNVYVSGNFTGNYVFGNDTLIDNTYNDGGNGFLVKYDPSGNVIWAKNAGGTGNAYGNVSVANANGNVCVAGFFQGPFITFGNDTLTDTANNAYNDVAFIVKYDASGNVIWAKNINVVGSQQITSFTMNTDALGNIYILASYVYVFTIAKFDSTGTLVWTQTIQGSCGIPGIDNVNANSVSTDVSGNAYITGQFIYLNIVFGNDTLSQLNSYNTFFLAKIGNTSATGIADVNSLPNAINVYPNPSTGTFYFTGVTTGVTIEIYNVLGEMVFSSIANNSKYQLNLNSEAKGIYFYRITDSGQTTSSRPTTIQQGKIVVQ